MSKFDNTGKGALWSNKYWAEGEKGPKWTGKITADRDIRAGEEIPLAVWPGDRKSESSPVMRLTIDRWKENKAQRESQPVRDEPRQEFDDRIPF